jgi:hypothetical protein
MLLEVKIEGQFNYGTFYRDSAVVGTLFLDHYSAICWEDELAFLLMLVSYAHFLLYHSRSYIFQHSPSPFLSLHVKTPYIIILYMLVMKLVYINNNINKYCFCFEPHVGAKCC